MKSIKKEWIIVITLLFILASIIITRPLNDLDEIWNYNFARNIAEGKMPYKDFNMIQTPLVPILCSVFLNIFGNELIVMRILAIILCAVILFITYKILQKLKVNKYLSFTFIIFLIYILKDHFRIDYNFFVLLNVLIIIYMELKLISDIKSNEDILIASRKDIFLGILAGICICSKQTTGICVSIVLLGYHILNVRSFEEFKSYLKKAIFRAVGILVPILILAIYFTVNNLWKDFIDYCILGISTFTNYIPYSNLISNSKILIKILSIIIPIFLISTIFRIFINKLRKKEFNKKLLVLVVYAIAQSVVVFPISDDIHFLVGAFPTMIAIVYVISILGQKFKNKKIKIFIKEYLKVFNILAAITCSSLAIMSIYNYVIKAREYNSLEHFNYISQSEEQINGIKEMGKYIQSQNKKVYILDATSAIYTIPINRYTKNYDMLMKGNFGARRRRWNYRRFGK